MVERSSRWVTAGWLALLALVATLLQRVPPHPWDADTHYHLAVARLLGQHGILHAFPWTPFSWLSDHYADKELVFHLLMVPFAGLHPSTASWLVGSVCGALLLIAIFEVLRREGVERPGLWTLAALACSGAFLLRFLAVRPHLLSVPLALLVTWSAARRRFWLLGLCAFAYPFTYIGWHLALVMAGLVELARGLVERRVEWRTGAVVLTGVGAGLLAHPNFPENLEFWRLVLMDVLVRTAWTSQAGFAQGTEFLPLGWTGLLRYGVVPLAATGWALVVARRRGSTVQVGFALAALALAVLTFRTQRFVEYWVPFAAVAVALTLRDRRQVVAPALALALGWTLVLGRGPVE